VHAILPQRAEFLQEPIAIYREILRASRSIALLGTVAAGNPLEPIEDGKQIVVPKILLSGGENFALRVRGDSMSEDGIRDGDVLVVKRQSTAESGQTVVAVVNGEATVKRYYRLENAWSSGPLTPREVDRPGERSVEIRGIVIGLIRKP